MTDPTDPVLVTRLPKDVVDMSDEELQEWADAVHAQFMANLAERNS